MTFEVGPGRTIIRAHKLILTNRCEIFAAMFRKGAMRESEEGIVRIEEHAPDMVSKMLEFLYTNRVSDLTKLNSNVRPLFLISLSSISKLTKHRVIVAID